MELIDTFFNVPVLIRTFPLLIQGLWITLQLGVVSIIAGLVLGLALALMRLYAPVWVQVLAKIYINFMRSIPLLVLLIIIYHALPFVGIRLSPFMSAVSALSLVSAAHTAEIFRAGIAAIAKVGSRALPRWASTALGLNRTGPQPHWAPGPGDQNHLHLGGQAFLEQIDPLRRDQPHQAAQQCLWRRRFGCGFRRWQRNQPRDAGETGAIGVATADINHHKLPKVYAEKPLRERRLFQLREQAGSRSVLLLPENAAHHFLDRIWREPRCALHLQPWFRHM